MVKNFYQVVFFDHHFFEKIFGQNFLPSGNFFDRAVKWLSQWLSKWLSQWLSKRLSHGLSFPFIPFNFKSLSSLISNLSFSNSVPGW